MKKTRFYLFGALLIAAALWQCSKDDGLTPGPGNAGQMISDEVRLAALEACRAKIEELGGYTTDVQKQQLVAWLLTQPEFQDAGIAEENNVYAIFADGRFAMFVSTAQNDTGGRTGGGREKPSTQVAPSTGRTSEVPAASKVSLFNGMGKYFPDNTEAIQQIFTASKEPYQVERKAASIENLKQVSGAGIFYFYTHGGGALLAPKKDSVRMLGLWTTDTPTAANEGAYKDDLDNKRLGYMLSTYDTDKPEWHYGITAEFVKRYMSFAKNCLIYIDACNSMRAVGSGPGFRGVVMDKAAGKQATYIGWTFETNAFVAPRASQYIFDRLLASNTSGFGGTTIPKEDPIQRPFDVKNIFDDLRFRNYHICDNGAQLVYETRNSDYVLLRPSIEFMEVDEYSSTLILRGMFGTEEGKVTVDGVAAAVTIWDFGAIACVIPEEGEGSVGDVVVSVGDIKSNPVPLSEYNIKMNYSVNDEGLTTAGEFTLRIRADVHRRRTKPREEPKRPSLDDIPGDGGRAFARGSKATYTIRGARDEQCNASGCSFRFTETPVVKSGTVDYDVFTTSKISFIGAFYFGAEQKTITIPVLALSLSEVTPSTFEERINCPGADEIHLTAPAQYTSGFVIPSNDIPYTIKLDIAENYNIGPGDLSYTVTHPWNSCTDGKFVSRISWEVVRPRFAPTDETMARTGN